MSMKLEIQAKVDLMVFFCVCVWIRSFIYLFIYF